MKMNSKYNKAIWAAVVNSVCVILEWQPGIEVPTAVQGAITVLVVFLVGNKEEVVE